MVSFSFLLFILFLTAALHAVLSLVSRHCLQFTCRFLFILFLQLQQGLATKSPVALHIHTLERWLLAQRWSMIYMD